jgi:hypothetical protein
MNKVILSTVLLAISYCSCLASYEVDFLIGETKNTQPLTTSFRIKSINLSKDSLILNKDELKVDEIIQPSQSIQIKVTEENVVKIDTKSLCEFYNSTDEENKKNPNWQSIILEVQKEDNEWEEVPLYWAHSNSSVFVNGHSENFLLAPFQRNFANKRKDGTLVYTIEVGLIKK